MITLLVFITGGLLSILYSFVKNFNSRREIRRQFYLLTDDIAASAFIQGKRYQQAADELTSDGLKPLTMGIVDFYQPGVFKDIGYVKNFESIFFGIENRLFFRLFDRKNKLNAFYACWKSLSSILFWQEKANTDFKFVLDYYNELNARRNKGMIQFEKLTFELFKSWVGRPQASFSKSYYNEIMSIKIAWGKLDHPTAPNIANKFLVQPILEKSMNNTLDEAQAIRFCLMEVEDDFVNIEKMMANYKQQFLKYAEHMKRYGNEIVTGAATIKKLL